MKKQIFIAVACLLFVGVLAACAAPEPSVETPEPTPTVSENPTVSDAPAVSNSPAPGNPTYTVVDGFLISDGVLIEYIGNETNLVIPKEVLTITETSFSSCAKKITTLTLGDRVREIHPLAFAGMTNLEEFHTSPENPLFTYEDGVLYDRFKTLAIMLKGSNENFLSLLYNSTFWNPGGYGYVSSENELLLRVHHNAIFTIRVEEDPDPYYSYCYFLQSIDFNDIHFEPEEPTEIFLRNAPVVYCYHPDALLFTQRLMDYSVDTFLLTDGQTFNLSVSTEEDYCYFYEMDSYGTVTYTCIPSKYNVIEYSPTWPSILTQCTGYNEFYSEKGYVHIEDEQIVYRPTEVQTVGEALRPDSLFTDILNELEGRGNVPLSGYGYPAGCTTLKEIFAYNKEHCESAQPPHNSISRIAEDVYLDVDGTLTVPSLNTLFEQSFHLHDFIRSVAAGDQICSEINQIIAGNVVLQTQTGLQHTVNYNDAQVYVLSLTAWGQTIYFGQTQLPLNSTHLVEADNCLVLLSGGAYIDNIWLVNEHDITHLDNPVRSDGADYTASWYRFHSENGQLYYARIPSKYNSIQYVGALFKYCVSRDELYQEIGTVTFNNGQPIFHPTELQTISDAFDLDRHYAEYVAYTQTALPATLDEYLAQNALKYQRAY